MKLIAKNKYAFEKLTPIQKRNRKLKHIKHDTSIKSEIIEFDKTLIDKDGVKYKKYKVGDIHPALYNSKNTGHFNKDLYDPRYLEFKEEIEIPVNRLILKPNKKYTLIVDYPLSIPYEKEIQSGRDGMTLKEVINLVVDAYKKIYKEEAKTSKLKEESISKRTKGASNLINRAETNGKYGIWGHSLEDLTITHIIVKGSKIYLSVDS